MTHVSLNLFSENEKTKLFPFLFSASFTFRVSLFVGFINWINIESNAAFFLHPRTKVT